MGRLRFLSLVCRAPERTVATLAVAPAVLQQNFSIQRDFLRSTQWRSITSAGTTLDQRQSQNNSTFEQGLEMEDGDGRHDQEVWMKRFQELKEYKKEHGDCLVPLLYEPNKILGHWVQQQRQRHHKRTADGTYQYNDKTPREKLLMQRYLLLVELGFAFNAWEKDWSEHYQDLKTFYQDHGNCLVPQGYAPNPGLSHWVRNQREFYKNNSKKTRYRTLSAERVALLNELKFEWNAFEARWMTKYEELKLYMRNNDGAWPKGRRTALGRWVHEQQLKYARNKLSAERIAKLEALGFVLGEDR